MKASTIVLVLALVAVAQASSYYYYNSDPGGDQNQYAGGSYSGGYSGGSGSGSSGSGNFGEVTTVEDGADDAAGTCSCDVCEDPEAQVGSPGCGCNSVMGSASSEAVGGHKVNKKLKDHQGNNDDGSCDQIVQTQMTLTAAIYDKNGNGNKCSSNLHQRNFAAKSNDAAAKYLACQSAAANGQGDLLNGDYAAGCLAELGLATGINDFKGLFPEAAGGCKTSYSDLGNVFGKCAYNTNPCTGATRPRAIVLSDESINDIEGRLKKLGRSTAHLAELRGKPAKRGESDDTPASAAEINAAQVSLVVDQNTVTHYNSRAAWKAGASQVFLNVDFQMQACRGGITSCVFAPQVNGAVLMQENPLTFSSLEGCSMSSAAGASGKVSVSFTDIGIVIQQGSNGKYNHNHEIALAYYCVGDVPNFTGSTTTAGPQVTVEASNTGVGTFDASSDGGAGYGTGGDPSAYNSGYYDSGGYYAYGGYGY